MASSAPSRVARRLVVRRLQQRLGALVVATALVGASVPAMAIAAPTQEEIGRMYGEGQEFMEQKEYGRAAEVFTRLLNLIDESAGNKAIRESLILNILDAHMQAYEGIVDADGKRDVEQLREGKATLQQYYKDFQAVHGDSVAVIAEIQTSATKLDQMLADATEVGSTDVVTEKPEGPVEDERTEQPPPQLQSGPTNEGLGFIIGGVGLGVLGIGTAIMIPVGSALGNDAEDKYNEGQADLAAAESEAERIVANNKIQDANDDGERANAVLISGAVLTPLLLGGAVALIVIGVKKRNQSQRAALRPRETLTAAPAVGRDRLGGSFTGFTLQGRF
ncbi:MAG: hypothetical protein ACE37F_31260 [Nannocystaceae bacterium]|nr:hypothetical protein [bacterium]